MSVPRHASDGRVIKPQDREPWCVHSQETQPASACRYCGDPSQPEGRALQEWKDRWAAWLQENPDSWEARAVDVSTPNLSEHP